MKKSLSHLLGALVLAAGLVSAGTASAVQISGSIALAGGVIAQDSTATQVPLGSATQLQITSSNVFLSSIDFGGLNGAVANWVPTFVIDPSTPYASLWTVTSGPITASFDLTGISIITQNNTFLNIEGSGLLKLTGKTATPGSFTFTVTQSGGVFGFGSTSTAQPRPVPEGGAAVALLGLGLIGLAGARRHFKSSKA
jgi:hypothetical protein